MSTCAATGTKRSGGELVVDGRKLADGVGRIFESWTQAAKIGVDFSCAGGLVH